MNRVNYLKVKTETFDKGHRHFGGLIYPSDFNVNYRGNDNIGGSVIASRIESDFRREKKLYESCRHIEKGVNTYGKQ